MQPTPEALEQLRALAERLRGQAEKATSSFQSMMGQVESLEATAVSDDGLITVTVGADGRLRTLRLDPGIYRSPDATRLARAIEETTELAMAKVQEQARQIMEPFAPRELIDAHLNHDTDAIVGGFADLFRER